MLFSVHQKLVIVNIIRARVTSSVDLQIEKKNIFLKNINPIANHKFFRSDLVIDR